MNNQRVVSTLKLKGEDSVEFINSLIRPTAEETEHWRRHLEEIDNSVTIQENAQGFEVEFKNLDLSFLEEPEESIKLMVTITSKKEEDFTEISEKNGKLQKRKTNATLKKDDFNSFGADICLPDAA